MAIKNNILINLETAQNNLINKNFYEEALKNIFYAKELCQKGLSKENFIAYEEVYDGIILALNNLTNAGEIKELKNLALEFLTYLINETQNENKFKKEIVFLPIQAAMWDSLESVWKEAYNDKEHCITYVIPLPYTNVNRDQSINEWRSDTEEFPKYVPTVRYNEVDLEAMHPDVIFINNPYDDITITMTQNKYFSEKLKNYTDKLVYIPYFVLEENKETPIKEEDIKNFALTYGVLYADNIIIQSEEMKRLYINVLIKEMPSLTKEYWENKIIAAGSPKIDKVIFSKKEDFDLPENWSKIIKNKKVILYNTSLKATLKNIEKVIDKLKYIFEIFKNRNDVALWWRPHPLLKNTVHFKYPEFEKEYLKLEKKYIEEDFGIYDETGDLHRAICYSDAYYGDLSSVIVLYKNTGKPIMLENFDIVSN